ncbi:MAG: HypC/HybG/HupF family hydrogenase formation chaperone [Nannocystaceae bacterium]
MCLGVPGKIVEIDGMIATVDFWGVRRVVHLDIVDEPVAPGDYILNHVGFAIRKIPPAEVAGTLELYEQIMKVVAPDLLADEVQAEIDAAGDEPATGGPR